jgi:hypothetical protein
MQTAAQSSTGTSPQPRVLRVLLVPADQTRPLEVTAVVDSAQAFSDALGGCLLDDTTVGALPEGGSFTFYLADAVAGLLPDNRRAAALAARLGLVDRRLQARIRGPVLIAGVDPWTGDDLDVPDAVVAAAEQTGLTVTAAAAR